MLCESVDERWEGAASFHHLASISPAYPRSLCLAYFLDGEYFLQKVKIEVSTLQKPA
jgi:hypothetical protein